MRKTKPLETDSFVIGGLHRDDFNVASEQYEELGYMLVGFLLDVDGYHWKAVYAKARRTESVGR
jgi:hypothetical protein